MYLASGTLAHYLARGCGRLASRCGNGAHMNHDRDDFAALVERSGARGFLPKAELSGPALAALLG